VIYLVLVYQIGIATLRAVSPKVTPRPEITGTRLGETSLALAGEPGNLVSVKYVQLSLFNLTQEREKTDSSFLLGGLINSDRLCLIFAYATLR
jgi:hypothetical protein